ncbi:MAG: energy transducer TonB [Marinoscillum sp.]|uniref:energy transducer TonB n=1 Tax=Marinoscillum sp. TaxID=2024838 RepID=UPI0032F83E4A
MSRKFVLVILMVLVNSFPGFTQPLDVDNGYERGKMENGYKVGTWEYMGIDRSVELKIDYDRGALIYLKPDTNKYLVMIDSVWTYKKVNPHPRYLGSYGEFYTILGNNLDYPTEARRDEVEGTVFLNFEVNQVGKAVNIQVLNDSGGYFTDEIIDTFNLIPNLWLTAACDGKNVCSKFVLPFYFKLTGGKESSVFDTNTLNFLDGKKLEEVTVTTPRSKH